ncbi:MAG: hypothetical protein Ct9H300mP3_10750 [Gammaproteobacteria bacterium]|nr:MAG: hypothetical protein Ct9H300mP3_10750 [Gammaproteobacteria bacterium]
MLQELGFCSGIENYSRFLSDRQPGEPPPTLYDYLADDTLVFIDESQSHYHNWVVCFVEIVQESKL